MLSTATDNTCGVLENDHGGLSLLTSRFRVMVGRGKRSSLMIFGQHFTVLVELDEQNVPILARTQITIYCVSQVVSQVFGKLLFSFR